MLSSAEASYSSESCCYCEHFARLPLATAEAINACKQHVHSCLVATCFAAMEFKSCIMLMSCSM